MIDWLAGNWQNILVLGIVAVVVVFIVVGLVRGRKKGNTFCCGDCGRCGKQCDRKEKP